MSILRSKHRGTCLLCIYDVHDSIAFNVKAKGIEL